MSISINALDLIDGIIKREQQREAMARELLGAVAILVRRVGGRIEIPRTEVENLPPLSSLTLVTTEELDAVVIRVVGAQMTDSTPANVTSATLFTDIRSCARCEREHPRTRLRSLSNAPADVSHWALCPVTGEPILVLVDFDPTLTA